MEGQTFIHPLADVAPGAVLGERVRIGPFCHVGADVVLGDDVELVANVTVIGATSIGAGTKVYPQAALGAPPQNLRHKGGRTTLRIGAELHHPGRGDDAHRLRRQPRRNGGRRQWQFLRLLPCRP